MSNLALFCLKLNKMCKFFSSYKESLHSGMYKLAKYVRKCVVFWKKLHSWQKIYTTVGRDGRDKFQVWLMCVFLIKCDQIGRSKLGIQQWLDNREQRVGGKLWGVCAICQWHSPFLKYEEGQIWQPPLCRGSLGVHYVKYHIFGSMMGGLTTLLWITLHSHVQWPGKSINAG